MTLPSIHGHSRSPASQEFRTLARLAGPVVVTQVGMVLMGVVDTVLVGPLGAASLAAVSVGNAVLFSLVIFAMGTVQALDALVSQAVGAGREARTGHHLWQGLYVGLLIAVPLTVLLADFRWGLEALDQPPEVARLGSEYLTGRAWAIVPFIAFAACRSFLNGHGHTRPVMLITLFANVINAGADWVLIYGELGFPEMGVAGAGVATSVVRWFMLAGVVAIVANRRYRGHGLAPARPDLAAMNRVARLGTPIGGQLFLEVGVFAAVSVLAGWLGTESQAAHQIALTLVSTTFMVPLGVSIAATVRVGQQVGAGRPDDGAFAGRVALVATAGFMSGTAALFVLLPGPLAALFSPGPAVHDLAVTLLYIAAGFQLGDGLQAVSAGCLRGGGDTRTPLFANLVAHWLLGLPLGAALAFAGGLGVQGLWWGLTASLTLVALAQTTLFLRGRWRTIGVLAD